MPHPIRGAENLGWVLQRISFLLRRVLRVNEALEYRVAALQIEVEQQEVILNDMQANAECLTAMLADERRQMMAFRDELKIQRKQWKKDRHKIKEYVVKMEEFLVKLRGELLVKLRDEFKVRLDQSSKDRDQLKQAQERLQALEHERDFYAERNRTLEENLATWSGGAVGPSPQ